MFTTNLRKYSKDNVNQTLAVPEYLAPSITRFLNHVTRLSVLPVDNVDLNKDIVISYIYMKC